MLKAFKSQKMVQENYEADITEFFVFIYYQAHPSEEKSIQFKAESKINVTKSDVLYRLEYNETSKEGGLFFPQSNTEVAA